MSITAGDISDRLNFGGFPLFSLDIQYGLDNQIIDFSYPNPEVMRRMNGNSTRYRLNFGCELIQNTILNIGMAVSRVDIFIPPSTAIKITSRNPPISNHIDDFFYVDKAYWNSLARDHQEPLLSINNGASYSSLRIRSI